MAAQFNVMKGSFLRGLSRWIALRYQFLAGAGFTKDQHVCICRCNYLHLPQNPP